MSDRPCTKDTEFRWLCSCDRCSREAARSWHSKMGRVFAGSLSLEEANRLQDAE